MVSKKKFTPAKLLAVVIEVAIVAEEHTSTIEADDPADVCDFAEAAVESLQEEGHSVIDVQYENMGSVVCGALKLTGRSRRDDKKAAEPARAVITTALRAETEGGASGGDGSLDPGVIIGLEVGLPVGLTFVAAIIGYNVAAARAAANAPNSFSF